MKSKHLLMTLLLALLVPWAAQAQQLNENFDGNSFPPTDWTTIHVSGNNAWSQGSGTGNSGSNFAYRKDVSGGYEDYLITPKLEPQSGEELSFYLASQYSYNYAGTTLTIEVSTTTPTIAAFTTVLATYTSGSNGTFGTTSATDWVNKTVGLSAYVGQQIYIAFHAKDTGYNADVRIDDVTGVTKYIPPCPKPENLLATTDGATATLTWDGTAANGFTIDINGSQVTGQTSPYVFDVALSTTYNITVTADCDANGTSDPVTTSFTTPACVGGHEIAYTLTDSYGDGWNGASITLIEGCDQTTITLSSGSSTSGTLTICDNYFAFIWNSGSYDSECGFTFTEGGTTLFTKPSSLSDGQVLYTFGTEAAPRPTNLEAGTPEARSVQLSWTENGTATDWEICVNGDETNLIAAHENPYTLDGLTPDTDYAVKVRATDGTNVSCWTDEINFTTAEACAKPTNLAETNITTNSATLSWNGTSEQYVLQYRPWTQVGEDQIATGVLTTYTYDLSAFEGTGSVAIRHYDVSDMFQLNVDDIVVTNKEGTPVYTQGFEDGVIPSEISNMDLDGDGYVWSIRANGTDGNNNPYCVGNYCASSASWDQGPLFPDNWMIISGIELGGQISFVARGQDPEWSDENFAVFVSPEASSVEVPVTSTTYVANDLTPNTPYAWQVKSDCGEYQSNYVSSFFKTKDNKMYFTTDGNWNDVANWEDAEGNAATALPTIANNVQIDAEAIIPANYIAQVNKASIGTGSITIKDGGQLKQSSASLNVTVEKEIAGIGEENWDNEEYIGGWSFISSPFSGRTLYDETSVWNHVENMFPTDNNYDLYAFDPERTAYWINYKEESSHISFESSNGNAGLMYGEGYLYASQEDRTLNFVGTTGKSNNYTETVDYTYDETATYEFNGWKLVGNFFSCNAYINYVDADNNVLDANFYVMNAAGDGYTLSESSVGLPPCTGAFINYNATGKVQYSTEALETRGSGMLSMTVSQGRGNVDMARVRFGRGHNLKHMSFRNNSSKLYIPQDNDYAVVYTEDNVGEMPVSFKAEKNGTYNLSFNSQEVTFSYLHLIDNMTGADVNLLETPSYTFNASTTDYANRFRLVFATGSTVDGENFGFINNSGNLCIFGIEGEATVQVVDMLGHVLSSEQFSGSYEKSINAAPGVYMIRLIQGNDMKVQKIVVR